MDDDDDERFPAVRLRHRIATTHSYTKEPTMVRATASDERRHDEGCMRRKKMHVNDDGIRTRVTSTATRRRALKSSTSSVRDRGREGKEGKGAKRGEDGEGEGGGWGTNKSFLFYSSPKTRCHSRVRLVSTPAGVETRRTTTPGVSFVDDDAIARSIAIIASGWRASVGR